MNDISFKINEVASGLFQLKMPLPFRLDHINLYLLEDIDGWVLVDTGLNTEVSKTLWQQFLASGFFVKPIRKIFLTHLHPDHIGMSTWLSRVLDVPVFISNADWEMAQFLWMNGDETAQEHYEQYWRHFGLHGDDLIEMMANRLHYRKLVKELPDKVQFLTGGDGVMINHQYWEFISAPGHSPEHICLWNEQQNILISGDHVLPTITPNISLHPFGLSNPLALYLTSLERFSAINCKYYFPAHGPISENFLQRISEIISHHQQKFALIMRSVNSSVTVAELTPVLFSKELPSHQLMFAYAETAAHLIYLVEKNYLRLIDDGEWKFSLGELAFEEVDIVSNLPLSLISH